ncbi:phage tail assembly chaperone family protein, TAC [Pseudomonas sp. MG-9]|uniref:phage tail assembly chaperone family protein, TAC n=1 Tax=Pseudomonas sp. MG-9 TaxID=2839032 RepID=UPI001C002506|nr:phage tail assembly chaperone family protein, TAC [Pseudomonas sp. MG-9]MBT9268093.1 phage tail assembly chaperone family protein, TAC [Pseudomonas sp. MG-9]
MKLADLKKKGGVITDAFVKKSVEWTRNVKGKDVTEKFDIHVRRHAFGVMEAMFIGGEAQKYRNARYLAASVFLGPEGAEELPFDDAVNLDPGLGIALLQAVNEVNAPVKN